MVLIMVSPRSTYTLILMNSSFVSIEGIHRWPLFRRSWGSPRANPRERWLIRANLSQIRKHTSEFCLRRCQQINFTTTRTILPYPQGAVEAGIRSVCPFDRNAAERQKRRRPLGCAGFRSGPWCRKRHVPFRYASVCDALPGTKTGAMVVKFIY